MSPGMIGTDFQEIFYLILFGYLPVNVSDIFLLTSIKLEVEEICINPQFYCIFKCVFMFQSSSYSFWMISDFSHVIFFYVDKVHQLSHGEILGKVKHDLETLKQ